MNQIDLYTKTYYHLRNYGLPSWVMGIPRLLLRKVAYKTLPIYLNKPYTPSIQKAQDLVISFTSFPARINHVWCVVECMLRQSLLPSKIILWLSKDQFPNTESIPQTLRERENSIFEIRMVDGDIRSHKKYFYVCREYPDALVMLIDDDIIYPTDFVEKTYKAYIETGNIVCNYGNIITYDSLGNPLPYRQWINDYGRIMSDDFFFGSGGGVIFQPSKLYKDLTNIELAIQLTPTADDIWLNAMVRLSKQSTIKLESGLIFPVKDDSSEENLSKTNLQGGNDNQIKAINDYYYGILGVRVFERQHTKE